MRQQYRGYFIHTSHDSIKIYNRFDEDVYPFDDFLSVRQAEKAIDTIADANDAALNMVVNSLRIEKDNVISLEDRR